MAYSTKDDLLKGDIPFPARYGDGTSFVELAADEIDGQIGHLYVTPIVLPDTPENRPARLVLKKINNFLASGRLITDMAAAGEDRDLHAYGVSLIREAIGLLEKIGEGSIILPGATRIVVEGGMTSAPSVYNVDPASLVESYYDYYANPFLLAESNPRTRYPRSVF